MRARSRTGFTLPEVLLAVAILGILFGSLLAGISHGTLTVQRSREQMRATQIMVEKLDTIRLYSWDLIKQPGYISNLFTAAYYPTNGLANTSGFSDPGIVYTGRVTLGSNPITISYGNDLMSVKVDLEWQSRGQLRTASMNTLVSRYGLQRYVNQ